MAASLGVVGLGKVNDPTLHTAGNGKIRREKFSASEETMIIHKSKRY